MKIIENRNKIYCLVNDNINEHSNIHLTFLII